MLIYGTDPDKDPTIQDLSATDLDKQFIILNETVQQEIFSGHGITSPSLFGVMTAGKLGESNQLQEAYDIFKNTYAEIKQERFERAINYITKFAGVASDYKLMPVDPIGFKLSEAGILQVAPKAWILEKLGIDPTLYGEALPQTTPEGGATLEANSILTNLTGRQTQGLMRIVRQYGKGQLTRAQASLMLMDGFKLSEEQVSIMLDGEEDVQDV